MAGAAQAVCAPPPPGLRRAALDYVWLLDARAGVTVAEIARREGLSPVTVRARLNAARIADHRPAPDLDAIRARVPRAEPMFPVLPLTPESTCAHGGGPPPYPFVCMVCHASWSDADRRPVRLREAE